MRYTILVAWVAIATCKAGIIPITTQQDTDDSLTQEAKAIEQSTTGQVDSIIDDALAIMDKRFQQVLAVNEALSSEIGKLQAKSEDPEELISQGAAIDIESDISDPEEADIAPEDPDNYINSETLPAFGEDPDTSVDFGLSSVLDDEIIYPYDDSAHEEPDSYVDFGPSSPVFDGEQYTDNIYADYAEAYGGYGGEPGSYFDFEFSSPGEGHDAFINLEDQAADEDSDNYVDFGISSHEEGYNEIIDPENAAADEDPDSYVDFGPACHCNEA